MIAQQAVQLPLEISQHPHFINRFKGVSLAFHQSNNIYSFNDAGKSTLVKFADGELLIDQKRGRHWYRFVPEETLVMPKSEEENASKKTHLGSRHLLESFSHWLNLDDPTVMLLLENKNDQPKYQVSLNGNQVETVSKIESAHVLIKPSALLARFEDPTYIQEWGKKNRLLQYFTSTVTVEQIELPRFGLSFSLDVKKSKQWNCDQFSRDGFFVAQEQSLPMMGAYQTYLVLENSSGEKKVLVPEYELDLPKEWNAICPEFNVDRQLDSEKRKPLNYSTFDLKKNGRLESKSASSMRYLGLVFSAVQEYESAAYCLRTYGFKLTLYTKKELEVLCSIARMGFFTGDNSGNSLALQTYAIYLLIRHTLEQGANSKEVHCSEEVNLYKRYLSRLNTATALKLTREEELFLLKLFLDSAYDPLLHMRMQKLDPECAKTIEMKAKPSEIKLPPFSNLLDLPFPSIPSSSKLSVGNMLLTRINKYLEKDPVQIATLIKNATKEQKKWFRAAFIVGKKASEADWSFLFEELLNYPERYKSPPEADDILRDKQKEWWHEVVAIAEKSTAEERKRVWEEINPLKCPEILAKEIIAAPKQKEILTVELKKMKEVPSFSERSKPYFTLKSSQENSKNYKEWLKNELLHPTSHEPLYINELKRLQADTIFQKERREYRIKRLEPIKKIIEGVDREKNQTKLNTLEIELMALANVRARAYGDRLVESVQLKGKKRRALTLDDLIISFAKKDPASLIQVNPHLKSGLGELYKKIQIYLILSTCEQQRSRALQTLTKLEGAKSTERQDDEQQLGLDLLAERAYVLHENPAYLVFEHYANILMRKEQIDKLKAFLDGGEISQVMEMIMGSGKSKVLLPLLGLLKADGKKLSIVIVPQPLFESISLDTQRVLSGAFALALKALHFHRNTQFDRYTLQRIKDDLQEIRDKKECLIITGKSIQCFLLKFVEESIKQKGAQTHELLLMREILNMLSASHPLIDEVDTVLNVLHEVSFSTGAEVKPRDNEIKLIAEMYYFLYTDPVINKHVRIESLPTVGQAEEELSEKNYHQKVKPLLAENLLHDFEGHTKVHAKNYLLRGDVSKEAQAQAQEFYGTLDHEKQNYLALAAEQLNQFSMHSKIQAIPDAGVDSKTLNILWERSNENVGVLTGVSPKEMMDEFVAKGIHYDLMIDSGGYLKEGGNTQIARQLSQTSGKAVVFYNQENQQAVIENGVEILLAESKTSVDQRCAFLDQSHTIGSDVAYKRDAVGVVTISRMMLLRDLLQSVWRLRGLDQSQRVKFVISKEVQGIICQVLEKQKGSAIVLGDLLRFTLLNQTKQQGVDNFKALRQEMYSHIQQLLFKVLLNSKYSEAQRKETVEALEKFWIKNTHQEPRELFGVPAVQQATALIIPEELRTFEKIVCKLKQKLPHLAEELAPLQDVVRAHARKLENLLPHTMLTPTRDLDHDQTAELLDETQQETQTQLEVNDHEHLEHFKLGCRPGGLVHAGVKEIHDKMLKKEGFSYHFNVKIYFDLDPVLKDYSEAFSGVDLTLNMLQWNAANPKVADLKFFGSKRTPIHQIQFKNEGRALLRSSYEQLPYEEEDVYNLGFGFYDPAKKLTVEQQKLIVKIKFLNGESSYSKAEEAILKCWLEEQGASKMYKLLQSHILIGSPSKVIEFNSNSVLKKVFVSLRGLVDGEKNRTGLESNAF